MKLFQNLTVRDLARYYPKKPPLCSDAFSDAIFENSILFVDIKLEPAINRISHYFVFGLPDDPKKLQNLEVLNAWAIDCDEWEEEFSLFFRKWLQNAAHTLVMFDTLRYLPTIIQNLGLSSLSCVIFDLSIVFRLCGNGLPGNRKSIWFLQIDRQGFSENPNLTFREANIQYEKILQRRESTDWRQRTRNDEKLRLLFLDVLDLGDFLKLFCERHFENIYWSNSFTKMQKDSLSLYYQYYAPLIPALAFLSIERVQIDLEKKANLQQDFNDQFAQLQTEFQIHFQINLMDIQSPEDVRMLAKNFDIQLPSENFEEGAVDSLGNMAGNVSDYQLLMDGEYLLASAPYSEKLALLSRGLQWLRQNRLMIQLTTQPTQTILAYNFTNMFVGCLENPNLRTLQELAFCPIIMPLQGNIFVQISFKKIQQKIICQLIQNPKFRLKNHWENKPEILEAATTILQEDYFDRLISLLGMGQNIVDAEVVDLVQSFSGKMRQSFMDSRQMKPNRGKLAEYSITSFGGIPFFFRLPLGEENQISDRKLLFLARETTLFEIQSLIWSEIFEKGQNQPFPKMFLVFDDQLILQCPKKMFQSKDWPSIQLEIENIIQKVGRQVLPFVKVEYELTQIAKW